jgi:tetratricopeptide (TPR) repeat protein
MNAKNTLFTFWVLVCLHVNPAKAASTHTVSGVVITSDGTVVPEFTVTVKHAAADKPELVRRKHFKNGEFTIDDLTGDKYEVRITSPQFIGSKLDFDFKAKPRASDYCLVILHRYRNEARLTPGASYTVSLKILQQRVPEEAQEAYKNAVKLHREGKLDDALVEYGRALRAYPTYVEALSDLATIFILYNRPESALAFLHRAQEIDDCNPVVDLNVAIALTEQGNYPDALRLLKKVLKNEPRMALAHFYIAKIQFLQKHYDHAETSVRQAVENDPTFLDAWLLMENISLEEKKNDQAREALTHLRESAPDGKVTKIIDAQLANLGS